jgi:cobalamin biosynthesis protein CobD/CbiB
MSLIALIAALLLEQWRPLADRRYLFSLAARYAMFLERQFNAGEAEHGLIAWIIAVLPPVIAIGVAYLLLYRISPLLALLFNVAALYFTMGFRQVGHHFTEIHLALKADDLPTAREVLARWRGHKCDDLGREAIVRLTIEEALVASHRRVFGVVFWFILLPGPTGAVLYRLTIFLARRWGAAGSPETTQFGRFANRALAVLDWPALRVTAVAFAIVGDFEDAVYCWRTQAEQWTDPALGIVLASGAGALGVKLGMPIVEGGTLVDRPQLGVGEDADTGFLDSTVGLVWRALVLWLLMLLILGLATAVRSI